MAIARKKIKFLIAGAGILLPYVVRLPGVLIKGPIWFTSFWDVGFKGFVFFGAYNAIFWGSVLLAVSTFHQLRSAWFPVILGFAFPAIAYAFVDLTSSSTAALGLIFIPLYALPLVLIGWLAGRYYDRKRGAAALARDPAARRLKGTYR
jgi:hypothetical protein